ncbi:MAG: PadR family transcriptional regulator, partial [Candidatus Dormiibacterota bacterium]
LIAVDGTDRDQRYPERTVYHVTEAGSAAAGQWLVEILSTPRNEFPEFPAALSFLPLITPDAARQLLGKRRALLTDRLAEVDAELLTAAESYHLPRVTMLESEYLRAAIDAERRWVTAILEELADGSLTWSREELVAFGTQQAR